MQYLIVTCVKLPAQSASSLLHHPFIPSIHYQLQISLSLYLSILNYRSTNSATHYLSNFSKKDNSKFFHPLPLPTPLTTVRVSFFFSFVAAFSLCHIRSLQLHPHRPFPIVKREWVRCWALCGCRWRLELKKRLAGLIDHPSACQKGKTRNNN